MTTVVTTVVPIDKWKYMNVRHESMSSVSLKMNEFSDPILNANLYG